MSLSAAAQPSLGYRPRNATNQLKEIVEDAMEELFRVWDERLRSPSSCTSCDTFTASC